MRALVLAGLALVLVACQEYSPQQVAQRFWDALGHKDAAAVRAYSLPGSIDVSDPVDALLPISGATLGRTVIDGDEATVDATVVVAADKPFSLPLETHLERQDGMWRVDYGASVAPLLASGGLARFLRELRRSGALLGDQLNRSLDELQRSLPQLQRQLEQLQRQLQSRIPQLRQQLDELGKSLQELLQPHPQPPPAPRRSI